MRSTRFGASSRRFEIRQNGAAAVNEFIGLAPLMTKFRFGRGGFPAEPSRHVASWLVAVGLGLDVLRPC
jgi:hypothetical protein